MKKFLFMSITVLIQSCIMDRIDSSIDLGNKYRYVQDYPQTIIYHESAEYEGGGRQIIPPIVADYDYNERYIIALSESSEDGSVDYWIIDKEDKGAPSRTYKRGRIRPRARRFEHKPQLLIIEKHSSALRTSPAQLIAASPLGTLPLYFARAVCF